MSDYKNRLFCNRSCSSSYNNRIKPKRKRQVKEPLIQACLECDKEFSVGLMLNSNRLAKRQFCDECVRVRRIVGRGKNPEHIANRTKGDLFASYKNWQSARTAIRKHAELVYSKAGKPYCCEICGYSNYVEICHINPVKGFDDNTVLAEINAINNLILLCPNHHWELDNSLLNLCREVDLNH